LDLIIGLLVARSADPPFCQKSLAKSLEFGWIHLMLTVLGVLNDSDILPSGYDLENHPINGKIIKWNMG